MATRMTLAASSTKLSRLNFMVTKFLRFLLVLAASDKPGTLSSWCFINLSGENEKCATVSKAIMCLGSPVDGHITHRDHHKAGPEAEDKGEFQWVGQGEVQVHRRSTGVVVSEVDRSGSQSHSWQQNETQQQTLEQCPLPLGLDQGAVEDEDVSVETDADVDESVDNSEEENNKSDEAEVVGVYPVNLNSGGAHHADCTDHAVHDDDPVQECSGCLLHDEDDEGDVGGQDQEGGGDPGCYPHPEHGVTITITVISTVNTTIVRPSMVCCA